MRKSIIFGMALLSVAAVSCTIEPTAPIEVAGEGKVVTLGASVSGTKSAIDGEGKFTWQAGDAISVATTDGEFITFNLTSGAGTETAEFSAFVPGGKELGSIAIAPAGDHLITEDGVLVDLPGEIQWSADVTNVPLCGVVSEDKIEMQYIGGVVRIPVTDMPDGAAAIRLGANKVITGAFELGDAGIATSDEEYPDEVVITFDEAQPVMVFNFPVPVGEYSFSLAVLNSEGEPLFEKEGEAPQTIEAGTLLVFNELSATIPPVATLNGVNYSSVAAAIEAAAELTSGEALITFLDDVEEEIYITGQFSHGAGQDLDREIATEEKPVKVPVVIDGDGKTLKGSIEIVTAPVTVKNLTIVPQAHHAVFSGARNPSYAFGIYVHYAKYGVVVDNVTIDMAEAEADATAIFMYNGLGDQNDDGPTRDIVKNSVIKGNPVNGNRLLQFYQAKADFVNNEWLNAYSGYAARLTGWGFNALFEKNSFKSVATTKAVIDFRGGSPQLATLVLLDNTFGDDFTYLGYTTEDITAATYPNTFMPPLEYVSGTGEVKFKEGLAWAKIYEKNFGSANFPTVKYSTHFVAFSGTDIVTLDGVVSDLNGNKKGTLNMEGVMENGAIASVTNDFNGVLSIAVIGPKDGVTTPPAATGEFGNAYEVWTYFDGWDKAPLKIWDGTSGYAVQSMSIGGDMLDNFVLLGKNSTHNWHRVGSVNGANAKARVGNWKFFTPNYTFSDASYEQFVTSADGLMEGWYIIADADPGTFRFYARKGSGDDKSNDVELVPTHTRNYTRGNGRGFTFDGKPYVAMMSTQWPSAWVTIVSPEDKTYLMESQEITIPQPYCSLSYMFDAEMGVGHIIAMAVCSNPANSSGALVRYDLYPKNTQIGGNVNGPDVTVTPGGKF